MSRVLLLGERPVGSSPLRSLEAALAREGVVGVHSRNMGLRRYGEWLREARRAQALVLVQYHPPDIFLQRQFHLARLAGCTTIRWWVGTDVYHCLRDSGVARAARAFDAAVDLNVAVAQHLVEELAGVGIPARHSPSVFDLPAEGVPPPERLPPAVLAYLPGGRREFYGEAPLVAAVEANPDLEFVIVGDDTHSLRHYPNVRSLGWVEDMQSLWPQVGALVRMTEHDGLPRMVLEALTRGRQVIYRWPLAGCLHAPDQEAMLQHLLVFKSSLEPNAAGPATAQTIAGDAGRRFLSAVAERRRAVAWGSRLASAPRVVICQAGLKGWI